MATTSKAKVAPAAKAKVVAAAPAPKAAAAAAASPAPAKAAARAATVLSMNSHKKYAGLTEAEILAQPESEYMSKDQLAFFKEKLIYKY